MTFRRAFWSLPLAVSAAVLAHGAVFGMGHAPGGSHASEFLGALGAVLGLGVFGAFLGGLRSRPHPSVATNALGAYAPLLLAAAAAGTFALIELSEGRFAWGPWLEAALACVPLALGVLAIARTVRRAAHTAGVSIAAWIARAPGAAAHSAYRHPPARLPFASSIRLRLERGRAPPVLI